MEIEKILKELTLEEKAGLCSGRDFWHTKGVERLAVPSVMMCDGPHGLRKQEGEEDHLGINQSIETVCYPTASALAASFDRNVLRELGEMLGKECQAEHVGMLLGPGVNMKRSPLCGRNFEYFSEDPYLAGELGCAYVEGLQEQGTAACVKHFAANNQETRRMSGSSNMDERTLHEIYLPAFETIVKKGKVRGVMCAYNAINGTFCAENKELLTDILRKDWEYDGMVVTDWGAVKERTEGLKAGVDLEMPGGPGVQDQVIVEAVKSGRLDESVLDEAVRNVLKFIDDCTENQKKDVRIDREKCKEKSREFCIKSAVLLKNEGSLPLSETKRTVFIGEFAKAPRYQGAGSSHIHVAEVPGAAECAGRHGYKVEFVQGYRLKERKGADDLIAEAVRTAQESEQAVIFAGLPESYETEGCDREMMEIPAEQNRLIEAVAEAQPNTIVVLHGGAPMALPWIHKVSAVLCMYLGGQMTGEAAVSLLYGEACPSGKLAETWPLRIEDNPSWLNFPGEEGNVEYREGIYIGYRYYDKKDIPVLFPFGYGLSYTEFEYGNLRISREQMKDTELLTVTCEVKNIGKRAGSETVQLYVHDCESTVGRPIRELKAFEKVYLEPEEIREVKFVLDQRAFAYYEAKIHDWYVESGEFLIELGTSSRDIRLRRAVHVTGTKEIPIVYTRYSTVADLVKSEKGAALIQGFLGDSKAQKEAGKENEEHMGEGSGKAAEQMMFAMPLQSLVTFGRMTMKELDAMIESLNRDNGI